MDNLLDEMDISCSDLYRLHTGQRIREESDDSDFVSTISSEISLDHLKPPLYTFEEIQQKIGITEAQSKESGNPSNFPEEIMINPSRFVQELPKSDLEKEITPPTEANDYSSLAQYILNLLSPTFCYICNVPALGHYKTQNHNKMFFKWIVNNRHMLELFKIEYVESLVCFACRAVFFNSEYSDSHYGSEEHKRNVEYYCKFCMVHDDNPENHVEYNCKIINEEDFKNIVQENSDKNFTKFGFKDESFQSENSFNQHHPGKIIATKLILMLTPIYCYICQTCVNVHSLYNHYLERQHIIMLRKWLAVQIQQFGVNINPNLIYCEACNLELCGTDLAVNHYQVAFHMQNQQMYCPFCIVRGTPTAIFQHYYTWEHQYNCETLRLIYKQNINRFTTNVIGPENPDTVMPQEELAKVITLSQCKLCGVKFRNKEEANFHYCSKDHTMYVNNWLEKMNMFDQDSANNSDPLSSFSDISLISQQHVQDKLCNNNWVQNQEASTKVQNLFKLETESVLDPKIKYIYPCNGKDLKEKTETEAKNIILDRQFLKLSNAKSNINTKKLQLEQEIIEKNINSPVPIIKLPTAKNTNPKQEELYKNVNDQVRKLLYKVYCLKAVPMEKSLLFLKKFNKELSEAENNTFDINPTMKACDYFDLPNSDQQKNKNNTGVILTANSDILKALGRNGLVVEKAVITSGSYKLEEIRDTLFTLKNNWTGSNEDYVTQFLQQQKSFLEYERTKLKTIKNMRKCGHSSLTNFSLNKLLYGNISRAPKLLTSTGVELLCKIS